jgi:hypothetical protein
MDDSWRPILSLARRECESVWLAGAKQMRARSGLKDNAVWPARELSACTMASRAQLAFFFCLVFAA